MRKDRWQALEERYQTIKRFPKEVILPKVEEQVERLQRVPKKAAIPVIAGVGLLIPSAIYADAALEQSPQERSRDVADFLDNGEAQKATEILMAAGVAITLRSYFVGKRNDEPLLRTLRVSGPALLTAAAGAALLDSHVPINYAIPAGLAWAGAYTTAVNDTINTLQGTRKLDIGLSTLAADAGITSVGATIFLAAAGKL